MFWFILFVVSALAFIYSCKRDVDWLSVISGIALLVTVIVLPIAVMEGMSTYPSLVGQLHRAKALQQKVDDIRNAAYPERSGELVGGSLTNLQQSSRLSDYIRRVAEAEAEYESSLAKARFYKTNPMWIIFGHGFFVSGKVFELPPTAYPEAE